jgi:hypothetical protein
MTFGANGRSTIGAGIAKPDRWIRVKKKNGAIFSTNLYHPGTIRPGDVYDGYRHANAARKQLFYDMRQKFLGELHWG